MYNNSMNSSIENGLADLAQIFCLVVRNCQVFPKIFLENPIFKIFELYILLLL